MTSIFPALFTIAFALSLPFQLDVQASHMPTSSLPRFEPSLKALKLYVGQAEALKKGDVEVLRKVFIEKDARKYMFRIEGLVRLYRASEAETAKALLKKIKELEDVTGDYIAAGEFAAYGRKIKVDQNVQRILEQQEAEARIVLDTHLTKWFLKENPYIDTYAIGLSQLRNRSNQELVNAFKREVQEVKAMQFDLNLLDEGVHELRRQVRWLNIYAEGLGDLFYVTQDTLVPDDFRRLECTGLPSSALKVEKHFTRKLSRFLTDIGTLKDMAEPIEAVEDAYIKAGVVQNMNQAQALVRSLFEMQGFSYPDTAKEAKIVLQEFNLAGTMDIWTEILNQRLQ